MNLINLLSVIEISKCRLKIVISDEANAASNDDVDLTETNDPVDLTEGKDHEAGEFHCFVHLTFKVECKL